MLDLLRYPFMRNALITGSIVAVLAGAIGYFIVARSLTFAAHAIPNIGFAGAAGAVLTGILPVYGFFAFALAAAVGIGIVGKRARERDIVVAVLMTFALGLGFLFLSLYAGYAQRVYGILFGSILGISVGSVWSPESRRRLPWASSWRSIGPSSSALSTRRRRRRAACPSRRSPRSSSPWRRSRYPSPPR